MAGGSYFFIMSFGCLIGTQFAVRSSSQLSVALLFGFGMSLGLAVSPTVVYYASADPQALWQAGGATALFVAGCGAFGYATRTDLSGVARVCFWALLALIMFGVVLIFVHIPAGAVIYSILGLLIFAGLTMADFQRLRRRFTHNCTPSNRPPDITKSSGGVSICRIPEPAVIHWVAPSSIIPPPPVRVLVLKATVDHVGHGFEPPMWMPGCAFGLTGRVVHRAHLVHMHERIKQRT